MSLKIKPPNHPVHPTAGALALHKEKVQQTSPEAMPLLLTAESPAPSSPIPKKTKVDEGPFITVKNMSASWSNDKMKLVLQNISLEQNQDSRLLAVIGPVGAGKVLHFKHLNGVHQILRGVSQAKGCCSQSIPA